MMTPMIISRFVNPSAIHSPLEDFAYLTRVCGGNLTVACFELASGLIRPVATLPT
jgi:hypothetical protein